MARPRPLPREPRSATVDGFTHGGEGVARVEGKAVFVPGALPGERVLIEVVDDRARWARARLIEVLDPSPDRVEPPCPFVPDCGGCDLQHVDPAAARDLKRRVVIEQLTRIGGLSDPPVADCEAVSPAVGYRIQARMHAGLDGALGFHRAGSDEVVAVDRCLVLDPGAQELRERIGDHSGAEEVSFRQAGTGNTGSIVLTPGPGTLELPGGDDQLLLRQPDGATVTMREGRPVVLEVDGLSFEVPAESFFQPSLGAATALMHEVVRRTGDLAGALTWDLYAGVGLLSLALARAGAEVVAVEGDVPATAAAERNAAANGLPLRVVQAPVGQVLARAAGRRGADDQVPHLEPPDVVVLDPPRSGAGEAAIADLAACAPAAVVYVACDVAALARDTRTLTAAGYELLEAVPLDLFPMTHHVEVVASFRPR